MSNNPRMRGQEVVRISAAQSERGAAGTFGRRGAGSGRLRLGGTMKRVVVVIVAIVVALAVSRIANDFTEGLVLDDAVGTSAAQSQGEPGLGKFVYDMVTPAKSTPRGEWAKGQVPVLYQVDRAWSGESYAGGTIAENGCGPVSLSMAYVALTGKRDKGPVEMCAFSEENGYAYGGATRWELMSEGARKLGLTSEELPASAGKVLGELREGHPVICIMGPGDFTKSGHFIVLSGVTEDGLVEVKDPNSPYNTKKLWDVEVILRQCKNLWALSA